MRDKVKRFISILMTALMLVNLLPVGALAEGVKISNSVQGIWEKPSANVYVYVKVTGDTAGLTINPSGWYTIGKSTNVPGMGTPYSVGPRSFSTVGVWPDTVLDNSRFTRWTDNQKIDLDQITWTEFYVDNGADDYVKAGTYTWHMNGTIDIKQLPSVYTIKYVDYDTKELIHSYEKTGLMGQTPEKVTAPDSLQENLYSFYFVNGHPKEQTVDFKKDKGELTFYYKKNTAAYTVNYYLNGTKTKVAEPKKRTAALGKSVTESPITVEGYTPVSNDSQTITIKANSDKNVINFYYYKNVTLTANSDTATYDGKEHSVSGFTGAPEGADFSAIKVGASGTDAGTYDAIFPTGTKGTVDATKKYIVTKVTDGKLVISKRSVTLTSGSGEKVYDGTALTNDTVTVGADGFADGEGAAYDVTGSRTDVGESDNTFTYTLNKGTKADNYTIEKTEGKLKVTAATEEVVVTIKENAGTEKYDGTEKTVTGYTVKSISNKLYTEKDFTFNGTAEVKGTDAGTYDMALKPEDFTNTNANFAKVTFKIEDGQLVIEKRKVTLTSGSGEKVYDGMALTNGTVTVGGADGFADGEGATYDVTGSRTDVGESDNTFTYTLNKGTKADNYTIEKTEGKLKVTAATEEVVVTIKENAGTEKYDGTEKTVTGYTVKSISNKLYTEKDFTFNGTAEVKGTDAGTYDMALKPEDFQNTNTNFAKVTFKIEDGQLVINKRNVTLTSETASKEYDGTALTRPVVAVTGDGFVDGEVAGIAAEGEVTHVSEGEVTNTITYTPVDGKFDADNYTITKKEGKLSITPLDGVVVTIKGRTKTVTYNGEEHTAWQYDVISISDPLYETAPGKVPNFWNKNAKGASGTDAGTYFMGWKAEDFENTNTNFSNVTFVVTDGKLVINPRPVMLTSANLIKVYDGTPLTNGDAPVKEEFGTEKAFPEGEGVTYAFTGGQTNAGSSKNMFTYAWNEGTNKDNYTIYQIEGDLVVTPIDGIKVTITGHKDTQTYDGKPHKVEGYDVKPDNPLFTEKDIEFNGEAEATGTDVRIDPYQMGLKPEQFTNTSNNFTNVEFVVEDGQIVITPRPVTLTSETAGKTYDGTALEKPVVTVGGDGFVEGQVTEIKATGSVTNAGSVANTITFTPNKETFKEGNYAITKTEGTLTIAKRSVLITSQSATKTYDGSALTRPAVTITGDGFVPGELAKAEATGSITNVGSTPNAIQYTTTGAFNAANYSIALSVGTLTVTERPQPEPRRTFNLTINYVYQNGKRAAASYNRGGLKNGETFDITSPVIAGYTASETVVSGTIYNRDIKVTVIYTADGVNLDDYGVPLGLGNITMNVGDCFE